MKCIMNYSLCRLALFAVSVGDVYETPSQGFDIVMYDHTDVWNWCWIITFTVANTVSGEYLKCLYI